jgi:hypothetical protein
MLGAINQTLQTLITAATFRDGLTVAGVVLNNPVAENGDASLTTNRDEIARRSVPPILGELAFRDTNFSSSIDWYSLCGSMNGSDDD